ncbi:MAG: bifunctional hydroxymethylpyrimidine kinase/phosphomethylpyrimidine kinase [Enterobacteriaceae bacterium]
MSYKCLSIAGFDGSGGAGIQADLKTFSALGCYGMTVLTALPVQNTCGVRNCYQLPLSCIEEQLEAIFDDIVPDAIKIGMLFNAPIINLVANFLAKHAVNIPLVLDPVMVAKSGDPLLLPEAVETLKQELIPLATLLTPNLPEAYTLIGEELPEYELGQKLLSLGCHAVLLKGGHKEGPTSDDLFIDREGNQHWLRISRIESRNTHGTGCTLSAAICALLAQGMPLLEACQQAKEYLFSAIAAAQHQPIGKGNGPVHHFHRWWDNTKQKGQHNG